MYQHLARETTCLSCRLNHTISSFRIARSRRTFTSTSAAAYPRRVRGPSTFVKQSSQIPDTLPERGITPDEVVEKARKTFGDKLPAGLLSPEELKIYERKYGKAQPLQTSHENRQKKRETSILKETSKGLEEVDVEAETSRPGRRRRNADDVLSDDISASTSAQRLEESGIIGSDDPRYDAEDEGGDHTRVHPFTLKLRFSTNPSTIHLPKETFVDPSTAMLAEASNSQLSDMAHRIFGGVGLPYSESTPHRLKTMQQKPIALDASQSGMSAMEGNVFLAALMPGVYASVLGVLTETRKRLGTKWAEGLVRKAEKGELRILDAGGAGVGVLAVRDVLKAEWERMHEEGEPGTSLATADGKAGGVGASPPLGNATVLTGSDILRKRATQLLENTSFIPRLPDYVHTENQQNKGKFDIVIAPHTLWPLRENHMRRLHTQNLWSLLSADGGVLLLLEKGVPRGFEIVAAAREMLLHRRIASPSNHSSVDVIDDAEVEWEGDVAFSPSQKEAGMIIAPCTNHSACPVYSPKGKVKARKDICYFEQRYIRPAYLQRILKARDKNFEDVKFSYLAVMRGRDLRQESFEAPLQQDEEATKQSFAGTAVDTAENSQAHDLSFPRILSPPLKRRGHVTFDVCTPSATYERWTVTKSFGKQAYRDARKSSWGDIWAMGAKTRTPRETRVGKHARREKEEESKKRKDADFDEPAYGQEKLDGGKARSGKKIKGIRDKRDKKGSGNGRRKMMDM